MPAATQFDDPNAREDDEEDATTRSEIERTLFEADRELTDEDEGDEFDDEY